MQFYLKKRKGKKKKKKKTPAEVDVFFSGCFWQSPNSLRCISSTSGPQSRWHVVEEHEEKWDQIHHLPIEHPYVWLKWTCLYYLALPSSPIFLSAGDHFGYSLQATEYKSPLMHMFHLWYWGWKQSSLFHFLRLVEFYHFYPKQSFFKKMSYRSAYGLNPRGAWTCSNQSKVRHKATEVSYDLSLFLCPQSDPLF